MKYLKKLSIYLFLSLVVCSCSNVMYKQNISQGSFPDAKSIKLVKVGMSETEVTEILGEPTLKNLVYQNKWAYIATKQKGYEQLNKNILNLTFKDGKLISIHKDK